MKALFIMFMAFYIQFNADAFPTVCTIIKAKSFRKCLSLKTSPDVCGYPPRPCTRFDYYVPQFYTETTDNYETFFSGYGVIDSQLASTSDIGLTATEEDEGSYSFQAHTVNVPLAFLAFGELPCQGMQSDRFCFSTMSEHLGEHWKTGSGDRWQPKYLAWSASPKACLIKGALAGATGSPNFSIGANLNTCSFDRSWMKRFPPSLAPVCTAWGIHFPRYATVTTSDQTTASLVIASRIKSLGVEVFQTLPSSPMEKLQMLIPQASSCFREGQNIALLRAKGVSEIGRLRSGHLKNHLYVTWKPVSCKRDIYWGPWTEIWLKAIEEVCQEFE